MDKYEYTIKSDKIKKLVERKDYETAVKIADTIDWDRVKNVKMLSTVSQAYERMSRFQDAKDILLIAYECAPVGRRFLYRLTELAIKQGQFDEAEVYLKEFAVTSPQDPSRLILRYEIAQAKGEPIERLITILEAYQKREFEEKWSFELASLYYRAGKNEQCVKLCDEIVLWFGVGTYVDKAMELKQRIAPLTPEQIEKRENKEKYLRRLEDVQKEFEEKYRTLDENAKKAREQAVKAQKEQAVTKSEALSVNPLHGGKADKENEDEQVHLLDDTSAALQAELAAGLAREIETAAMSATIDEVMLRDTAVTMETVGAVENDHSNESERTKIANGHFVEKTKTKEFILQARAINAALDEAKGQMITPEDVEKKMTAEQEEESQINTAEPEESKEPKEGAVESAEPQTMEKEQKTEPETAAEPEQEASIKQKSVPEQEPMTEQEPVTEQPQEAEAPHRTIHDHYILIASDREEIGLRESVAYMRRMRELLGCPASQTAKISGVKLAVKDMEKTFKRLQGRDLIVVGIAELPGSVLAQAIEIMARDRTESFIALIDTEEEISRLQSRMAFFADCRVLSCESEPTQAEPAEEAELSIEAEPAQLELTEGTESSADSEPTEKTEFSTDSEPTKEAELFVDSEPTAQAEEGDSFEQELHRTLAELVAEALHDGGQETGIAEEKEDSSALNPSDAESPVQERSSEENLAADTSSVREMTPNEFFEFAVQYANMLDATVDDMGGLAVFAAAEQYQQDRVPLTEELAQELVEKAILRAEKRSFRNLFSNRYNKEGYLILKEEHFKE